MNQVQIVQKHADFAIGKIQPQRRQTAPQLVF
jgi:hypothetical protein